MDAVVGWYRGGGPTLPLIALVALAGVVLLAERAVYIAARAMVSGRPFMDRVIQLVRGGKVDEAIRVCAGSRAALPDIGLLVLRSRTRDEHDLHHVAEAARLTIVPRLRNRLGYLLLLAIASAALGAIGFALGLQRALAGSQAAVSVLPAVAVALTPLIAGMTVSLVLGAGYALLEAQAAGIAGQIEEFSARMINALVDRPDVRLGHR